MGDPLKPAVAIQRVVVAEAADRRSATVCVCHPITAFDARQAASLAGICGANVVAVNPQGPEGSSLERIVESLEIVRGQVGVERWAFWGISGGSLIAQLYARTRPDAVTAVVLASSGMSLRHSTTDPASEASPYHPSRRQLLAAADLLDEPPSFRASDGSLTATTWERMDGGAWMFRRRGGAALTVVRDEPTAQMKRIWPSLWAFDSAGWAGQLRIPALVICGSADALVPVAYPRQLAEALPGAQFLELAGAGHALLTERRDEVQRSVRQFLTGAATGIPPPGGQRE